MTNKECFKKAVMGKMAYKCQRTSKKDNHKGQRKLLSGRLGHHRYILGDKVFMTEPDRCLEE